jgi:hypothetical protein
VRIERLWRDIRKDCLETFRQIFDHLEKSDLLDMTNWIHRLCLYVVFQPRIQQSLNHTADAWNHHRLRTEHHKTPLAIYELSRLEAQTKGYWTGDPGDDITTASDPSYGSEDELNPNNHQVPEEDSSDIRVNEDNDIAYVRDAFFKMGFNIDRDDQNWGIDVYCEAVIRLQTYVQAE